MKEQRLIFRGNAESYKQYMPEKISGKVEKVNGKVEGRPMYEVMAEKNAEFEQRFAEVKREIRGFAVDHDTNLDDNIGYNREQKKIGREALKIWEQVDTEMDALSIQVEQNRYQNMQQVQRIYRQAEQSLSTLEAILRQKTEAPGETYTEQMTRQAWETIAANGIDGNIMFRTTGEQVPATSVVLPNVPHQFVDSAGNPVTGFEIGSQDREMARKALYIPNDQQAPYLKINGPQGEMLLKPVQTGSQIRYEVAQNKVAASVSSALHNIKQVIGLNNQSPADRGAAIKGFVDSLAASYKEEGLSVTENWQYALAQLSPENKKQIDSMVSFNPQTEIFTVDTSTAENHWTKQEQRPWTPAEMTQNFPTIEDYRATLVDNSFDPYRSEVNLKRVDSYLALEAEQQELVAKQDAVNLAVSGVQTYLIIKSADKVSNVTTAVEELNTTMQAANSKPEEVYASLFEGPFITPEEAATIQSVVSLTDDGIVINQANLLALVPTPEPTEQIAAVAPEKSVDAVRGELESALGLKDFETIEDLQLKIDALNQSIAAVNADSEVQYSKLQASVDSWFKDVDSVNTTGLISLNDGTISVNAEVVNALLVPVENVNTSESIGQSVDEGSTTENSEEPAEDPDYIDTATFAASKDALLAPVELPKRSEYLYFKQQYPLMITELAVHSDDIDKFSMAAMNAVEAGDRGKVASFLNQSYEKMGSMNALLEASIDRASFVKEYSYGTFQGRNLQRQLDRLVTAQRQLAKKMKVAHDLIVNIERNPDALTIKPVLPVTDAQVQRGLRTQDVYEKKALYKKENPKFGTLWVKAFTEGAQSVYGTIRIGGDK